MADIDFDAFGASGSRDEGPALKTMLNWAGGALSLALVAGLLVWAYQIMVRDVTGVPVVRALEGPIRVAPDDPGGRQAEHQGLAVNRVAAEGEAAPPADTLRLAPSPVALVEEDRPVAELAPAELTVAPDDSAPLAAPDPVVASLAQSNEFALTPELLAERGGEPPADEIVPLMELPEGALGRSLRPAPRPDDLDLAVHAAIASATAALTGQGTPQLAPEDVIAGTALVQLGAFGDSEEAREAWEALAAGGRFGEFFDQKARVIQQAESGGQTFYRLRAAGFDDMADARRFCAALVAEGADCIPVVAR
ncbi:Sporulation related domain-containing protein [Rhodovulum sp. ES.010]|uniref:SPOR domain-containing protein n=1 Tax=Rhodovulum sp. ES.010 TaxID=1882821 RepID=UPI000929E06F|nr:SPOR domain-containing protein [Rhodovulum sp. ES.010]SIO14209.1 Sporulation related domain-containing protein [Rhodovulum sp. ES.010]